MARTVIDIKKTMTDNFVGNSYVQAMYGFDSTKTFEQQFSTASLESIFFYVVALAIYAIESLFDQHKADVEEMIAAMRPHTKGWYQEKVFRFQYPGRALVTDSDAYDNTGLTADQIAALEIVKFCAIEENLGYLKIKVAKGDVGSRTQLSGAEETALEAYVLEVKDAGVKVELVNEQADKVFAEIEIYYNPLLLDPADGTVEAAFEAYVNTLEFNGLMKYNKIVDALQNVEGVELVNPLYVNVQRAAFPIEALGVQKVAESGYWIVNDPADLVINYIVYTDGNI